MRKIFIFFYAYFATFLFCAGLKAQNILSYYSDSYTQKYIVESEKNMVEPILTTEGLTDAPGIIQSKQMMVPPKLDEGVSPQNNLINRYHQPSQEQINRGNYYDGINKKQKEKEQEIYAEIEKANRNTEPNNSGNQSTGYFLKLADTTVPDFQKNSRIYIDAAHELTKMLSGEIPLDLKKAVFTVENSYYHNTLDYTRYCMQIDSLVMICKAIMKHFGDSPDNKLRCNYAIQALYQDTLNWGRKTFYPFVYDFDDFMAQKDYSKYFVTKLLNKGMGQCHSMPLLYLILAEELHTDAYLAYCPGHCYIKFPIDSVLYDFETTCGKPNTDEWIARSGFLSPKAVKYGIYLMPITMRQTIAQCLVELGMEYSHQYGYNSFSPDCAGYALQYYPKCLAAYQEIANSRTAVCADMAAKYHNPPMDDYWKYPDLKEEFDNMVKFQQKVDETGYVVLTKEEYAKWLATANSEKEKRQENELKKSIYLHIQNRKQ